MAFLILSEIAVGIVLALLTIPLVKLGRGFFAFHAGLALALEMIGLALDRGKIYAHGPFAITLMILCALFYLRKLRWTPRLLYVAAAFGGAALGLDAMPAESAGMKIAGGMIILSSAWVLGSALVTMNLGHWYLVIQGLPFDLLGLANRRFTHALLVRVACIGAAAAFTLEEWRTLFTSSTSPLWDTVLFLTVRVAFGLAAPLLLAWMVGECVKIKSNQSATGILYVAVVFVLIGELSGMYFLLERGVPL